VIGPTPSEPVRVLVVDADRRVRQSLAGLIRVSDGLTLTAAVGDPVGAMDALEGQGVDVVLIDPRLPEAEMGVALLGEIRARWPHIRVVALSVVEHLSTLWDEPEQLIVVSPASPEVLVDALRRDRVAGSRSDGHPWQDGAARPGGGPEPAPRDPIEDHRDPA
jgi:DNA-binding NarL/FixJ family response regulator